MSGTIPSRLHFLLLKKTDRTVIQLLRSIAASHLGFRADFGTLALLTEIAGQPMGRAGSVPGPQAAIYRIVTGEGSCDRRLPVRCSAGYDGTMGEEAGGIIPADNAGKISRDDHCFCCGKRNSRGLRLEFRYPERGKAETECMIPEYFTGWRKITHGGFLAMLLDETMAHSCISEAVTGVTVDIQVRYLKPVEVGQRIRVTGRLTHTKSRIVETEASIYNQAGEAVATASARFLKM
jgi:uncharacterized protein (TIGR00369 family)